MERSESVLEILLLFVDDVGCAKYAKRLTFGGAIIEISYNKTIKH